MEQEREHPQGRFIGRPWMLKEGMYPWRPLGNREKLAAWSVRYYAQYDPLRPATDTRTPPRARVTSPGRKPQSVAAVGGAVAGVGVTP